MSVTPTRLEYFVAVAEEGQITRAARRLNVAQPALSNAIAQLESDIGCRLFERRPRGVELTADGEVLYAKARVAVERFGDVVRTARTLARSHEAVIEFGFIGLPPTLDSPDLLAAYHRRHPAIDIRYTELPFPAADTSSWLAEVDVVACHRPPAHPEVWIEPLREEPRVLLAPRGHPLAGSDRLAVADVLEQTFIGFDPTVEAGWAGFWSLDDHRGGPPPRSTQDRAANPQEVLAALAAREAITTVPASVAARIVGGTANIVAVPLLDAAPSVIALAGHGDGRNEAVATLRRAAREVPLEAVA